MQITVKAKITAGFHPGLNTNITQGEEYTMEEAQWGDQLFERPSPEWLAPWEQPKAVEPKAGGKQK
jgi:hypothetical protein